MQSFRGEMRFGTGQLPVWRPIQPVNCKILIEIQEHPIKTRIPVAQQQFPFIINSTAQVRVNVLFYILPTHTFPFCGSHQHQQCTRPSEVLIGPSSTYISMRISVPVVHLCHSAEWSIRIFDILETHIHDLFMVNRNFQSSMLMRI